MIKKYRVQITVEGFPFDYNEVVEVNKEYDTYIAETVISRDTDLDASISKDAIMCDCVINVCNMFFDEVFAIYDVEITEEFP